MKQKMEKLQRSDSSHLEDADRVEECSKQVNSALAGVMACSQDTVRVESDHG